MTAAYNKDEARSDVYKEAYLYDLDNDPYEMVNLVGLTSFREVSDDLKARILRWIAEVEDGHQPEIQDAKPRFPRQYRLNASDLIEAVDRERDVDPIE